MGQEASLGGDPQAGPGQDTLALVGSWDLRQEQSAATVDFKQERVPT